MTHGAVRLACIARSTVLLYSNACVRRVLAGVFYENLATLLNEAKPSESAVHKRQFERVHNNVYEAKNTASSVHVRPKYGRLRERPF